MRRTWDFDGILLFLIAAAVLIVNKAVVLV